MNSIFYKKNNLNISYDYKNKLRYDSNFNNLNNYIDLFLFDLNNSNNQFYIVQIISSIGLKDEILRYKNKEKKEKYMISETYEQMSILDKFIKDERVGYYQNDNKKYTKEFNNEINILISNNKEKNINYDEIYEQVLKKYRYKRILELNLSQAEIRKITKTQIKTYWKRKFEIKLEKGNVLRFDNRNILTTIFCYGNYKDGFKILGIGGGGSSFQRQTFTEMSYVIQNVLNKTNGNILKSELLYYNKINELEIIKEGLINKFFINYDLGSNSDILHNNQNIKEQIYNNMPIIESNFFNDDNSIFNNIYIPYNILLGKSIDIGLLYIYENTDLEKTYLYFGDKKNAYGDNWNNTPANCNSGIPYSEFISSIIEFEGLLSNSIYSTHVTKKYCMNDIKINNKELYSGIHYGDVIEKTILKIKKYGNINKIY